MFNTSESILCTVVNVIIVKNIFVGYVSYTDICNEFSHAASHHARPVGSC